MSDAEKVYKFVMLIQQQDRISMRRAAQETGYCERTLRRHVKALSSVIPVSIENGVIVKTNLHENVLEKDL